MPQEIQKKEETSPSNPEEVPSKPKEKAEKLSFTWILLGVGAILLMWMVSAWLFKS